MDISHALVIAALLAIGRWVIRSLKEPVTELPQADRKPTALRPARPGQTTGEAKSPSGSQRRGAANRTSAATRHADPQPAWNIVLDVSEDAPRSEIQASAKRRIAQAVSNGDHAAVASITRAAAAGLKNRVLRAADAPRRGKSDP